MSAARKSALATAVVLLLAMVFAGVRELQPPRAHNEPMPERAFCAAGGPGFQQPFAGAYWNGWGVDPGNSRSQPAHMAGLTPDQVARLKLKWAFGVPGVVAMYAQPAIAGGRLFFGSATGKVYSVDAASGCVYWVFDAGVRVRTAISIGAIGDRWAAYFGDNGADVAHAYAVDASTGELIWKTAVDESRYSVITGAPVLASGKLYVPVTGYEDAFAADPRLECCTLRGSLVALDATSGRRVWKNYTIAEEARPQGKNAQGVQQWGPSGAGIWSAPTVDLAKRAIYVGTGDSHSIPVADTSDAILAFDMDTGAMRWSKQMTPGDAWNLGCTKGGPSNCPEPHGLDLDFGSSPILVSLEDGRRALIAGQKSGVVYALDPDHAGAVLWLKRIGKGGAAGGVQWGPAADGRNVYVALSDIPEPFPVAHVTFDWMLVKVKRRFLTGAGGGTFALRLATGEQQWYSPPQCEGRVHCNPAQIAPVTHIPGVAFSGSVDGRLWAYSTDGGRILWSAETKRDYVTVNGVKGNGGSMGSSGAVVAGGMLYVNSGYLVPGGSAGNVLLAFSVDGK